MNAYASFEVVRHVRARYVRAGAFLYRAGAGGLRAPRERRIVNRQKIFSRRAIESASYCYTQSIGAGLALVKRV